jgi:hypothetical protein
MEAAASIHQERLKLCGIFEGGLVHDGLVLQLLAQGGPVAGGLGEELTFHPALVLEEELLAAFLVEIGPAVPGLEMVHGEDLVAEEVQSEGFDEDGAEGFEEVQGEGPPAILGGVEEAEGGVEAVGVKEGDGFRVKEGRDFAENLVALGGLVAPEDFEALALEGNPATVLVNGGGGHLIADCGVRIAE